MTSSSQRGRLTFKREMFACLVVLLLDLILCLLVCSPQGKEKERLYNGGNLIPTPDQWPAQSPVVVSPADVSEAHFHNGFKSWVYTIWIAFRGNQGFYTHSFRDSNKVTLILTIAVRLMGWRSCPKESRWLLCHSANIFSYQKILHLEQTLINRGVAFDLASLYWGNTGNLVIRLSKARN